MKSGVNKVQVECVDIPDRSPYTEEYITTLISSDRIIPQHGQEFTGRPVTELLSIDKSIIKFRTEYQFAKLEAQRFVKKAIDQERKIGVHHPFKTWCLISGQDEATTDTVEIANITPLLTPLHHHEMILSDNSVECYLDMIADMIEMYLITAINHDISLDLSLSNFALTKDNKVYYLDDDFYRWNNFQDLPEFLANLLRSFDFLDKNNISKFGRQIRDKITTYFQDSHWLTVIAEELKSVFIPEKCMALRDALVKSLYGDRSFIYRPAHTSEVIALIADVHANAPALDCALDYIQGRGIEHTLVLGDIVGYGPHPKQCVDSLRNDTSFSNIRGNHDHSVATGKLSGGTTSLANWSLNWTIENLDNESKNWLASLPCYLNQNNWLAVHGSPRDKTFFNGYVYQMNYPENLDELESRNIRICFHGHTHVQKIYYRHRGVDFATEDNVDMIKKCSQALICPGSIGQPRSGHSGVELAIINLETLELEFQRLNYNIESTINDMASFNFPSGLMERLRNGT